MRLIFLDETGTNLSLTRRYGRAKRGQRVVGQVPRSHGPNVTLIAAMDQDGLCGEMTLTGALDGRAFETYVKRILVPHLWPGDVVICDNLSAHKQATARRGCPLGHRGDRCPVALPPALLAGFQPD